MNELSDERLGRTLDQIAKLALLNDAALVQEDDRIAKERRFAKVMSHEHHGFRQTAEYALEFALQLGADHGIERAQWFVHEENVGVEHQCSHQGNALTLTTGQFHRKAIESRGRKARERT